MVQKPKPRLSFTHPGQEEHKKKSRTSWGLFELVRLLFPPFPGLQQASQGGKLAAASAGGSVPAGDHGLWAHGGQSLYLLSCKKTKPGLRQAAEVLKICRKTSKTHNRGESHDLLNSTFVRWGRKETQIMEDSGSLAKTYQANSNTSWRNESVNLPSCINERKAFSWIKTKLSVPPFLNWNLWYLMFDRCCKPELKQLTHTHTQTKHARVIRRTKVGCYSRILTKYSNRNLWFTSLAKDHESGNNASSERNPQKYYTPRTLNLLQHKQRASKVAVETKSSRFIQIWAELVSGFMTAGQGEPDNLGSTFDIGVAVLHQRIHLQKCCGPFFQVHVCKYNTLKGKMIMQQAVAAIIWCFTAKFVRQQSRSTFTSILTGEASLSRRTP